jgi:LuxR family transcriptional regulator, maltose regulon positive regulatory protein
MEIRTNHMKDIQYPLLVTKLYVPQPRPKLVQRTQLINRLNDGLNHKLVLISAPAGFGKTTLLSEWISQSEIPVAWVSLDKSDSDPAHFIHYLVAALQGIAVNIDKSVLSLLQSPKRPLVESNIINLIKEISVIPNDIAIVLDDYHVIDAEEIHKIIALMLDYLPAHIHLVISSRVDPPLPLSRLRVSHQLTEVRTTDLCFTSEETTVFFNQMMDLGLSNRDIAILDSRTEGWIAGLQLAALSMRGNKEIQTFIKDFAGDDRHIVDYLTEEVLNRQPEPIRNFLLQTSILYRLSEQLCDFVTDQNGSQKILNDLDKANLFIVPLDNKRGWFRYHHLFKDLLQQRLNQMHGDLVADLNRRASTWHRQNGLEDEAVNHALAAKDYGQVALLIEEKADTIWERGEHAKFQPWLEGLPTDLVRSRPLLGILNAETMITRWRIDTAEKSLQIAEKVLKSGDNHSVKDALKEKDQLSNSKRLKILGRIAANHAFIASFREDVPGIIKHANRALELLPEQELTWRSTIAINLGDAHFIKGDLKATYQAQLKAVEICKLSGNVFVLLIAKVNLAVTLRQQGQLKQVLEICQQQIQFSKENGMSQTIVVGWFYAIWGEVLAELNDFDSALNLAKKGVELDEHCGDEGGMLRDSYLCLIRTLYSMGNLGGAQEIIQKLDNIVLESGVTTKIKSKSAAWQARIWLAQNKLETAAEWVKKCGLNVNDKLSFLHEDEYTVLARILIAQKQLEEANKLLQQLLETAETGGRTTRVIEIYLLQALSLQASGDTTQAVATLKQGIDLAEPRGFIQIFIDEGPLMAELLEKILESKIDVPRVYVKKLLSTFKLTKLIKTEDSPVEHLSERELEVLRFIAAGLSNKKIMEELFISMSTVKTHLRNIYSKLDVNSRTQATVKAKELELL